MELKRTCNICEKEYSYKPSGELWNFEFCSLVCNNINFNKLGTGYIDPKNKKDFLNEFIQRPFVTYH